MLFTFLQGKNRKRLVILAFFYVFFISSCDQQAKRSAVHVSGPTMGTQYNIKAVIADKQGLPSQTELKQLIDTELSAINQSMSTYIPQSELSVFNRAPVNTWHSVSADMCALLSLAKRIYQGSEKRFDPTVGPLVNLWGFGPNKTDRIPSDTELATALAQVGFDHVEFDCDKQQLRKRAPVYVDLSAIAKGFATDLLARKLDQLGYNDFMVEIGGELYVRGNNTRNTPWRIAVEKPALVHDGAQQVLAVSGVGVATSGEYRNYYEVDGRRISHTIDPLTARPIDHTLASVTVIADSGGAADAWATALNVLGPELGYRVAITHSLAAYFIVRDGDKFTVKYTPTFKQYMVNQ